MDELSILRKRLIKIGIEPIFMGNFPWIYLYSINGNVIKPEGFVDKIIILIHSVQYLLLFIDNERSNIMNIALIKKLFYKKNNFK